MLRYPRLYKTKCKTMTDTEKKKKCVYKITGK